MRRVLDQGGGQDNELPRRPFRCTRRSRSSLRDSEGLFEDPIRARVRARVSSLVFGVGLGLALRDSEGLFEDPIRVI